MDFEKENVVDLLLMVLYSLRCPDDEDALSDDEIDEALSIAIKKQKSETYNI